MSPSKMVEPVEFAAVLVTYRRPAELAAHIEAVAKSSVRPTQVIVIDNDPLDTPESAYKHTGLAVRYVAAEKNLGPAGGFAKGIELALDDPSWRWLLLLDDDDPPRTSRVLADLALAAAVQPDNIGAVGLAGGALRRPRAVLQSTLVSDEDFVPADYLAGGYHPLYRREALELGAPFDPELFFGFEELGAGLEIRRRGYYLVAANACARAHGYASDRASDRPASELREYYSTRNFVTVVRRYCPELLPAVVIRLLLGGLKPRTRLPRRVLWRARRRALFDAVCGRLGERERDALPRG